MNDTNKESKENENFGKISHNKWWGLLFIVLVVLTVWTITTQAKSFSFKSFFGFIKNLNPVYVVLAFSAMILFVLFEGMALRCLLRAFGCNKSVWSGFVYSSADIYFSAITPSASGGQPASGLVMVKDGISVSLTTVVLIVNLVMYTFAIIIIGIITFVVRPSIFLNFSSLAKGLIIFGVVCQFLLGLFFIMILKHHKIVHKVLDKILCFLAKIHIVRKLEKKREKLDQGIKAYRACVFEIKNKGSHLFLMLIYNILQRVSVLLVPFFVFLGAGGNVKDGIDVIAVQSFAVLGSNTLPIPGAMGIIDYLLLDGFGEIMDGAFAVNLELFSRAVSFYSCVIMCGIVFLSFFIRKRTKSRSL